MTIFLGNAIVCVEHKERGENMSEKEKQNTASILDVLGKLSAVKGEAFTEGLVAGILIGTASPGEQGQK